MKKILIIVLVLLVVVIGTIYISVSGTSKTFETCTIEDFSELEKVNFRDHDSVLIAPSTLYQGNFIKDLVQGTNYREAWSARVKFPIVFLDTLFGGLEVIKEGGGKQTHSLKLKSRDQTIYTLRSVTKDPQKLIPAVAEELGLENIIADGLSAQHPYAAILTAQLAETLDILNTNPKMVFVPKQPALGAYNQKFGNRLFLLEYETESETNWSHLDHAIKIVETKDLQELRFIEGRNVSIDQNALIRVRLFDLLIGDWDRHSKQWGWVLQQTKQDLAAFPVAGDRDNAFFSISGLIPSIVTSKNIEPLVRPFEKEIDYMPGLVYPFDRYFLLNTTEEQFVVQAKHIQSTLSNALIAEAFKIWPEQIRNLHEKEITEKLLSRREHLIAYAKEFYLEIQKQGSLNQALKGSEDLDLTPSQLACFSCQ